MDSFISSLDLKSPKIIIKPNWVSYQRGEYTDAKVLDMILTSIKKPAFWLKVILFGELIDKLEERVTIFHPKKLH